ncbi:MAG: hypothetical protein ACHQPH_02670 [Reyranellales bacterium]
MSDIGVIASPDDAAKPNGVPAPAFRASARVGVADTRRSLHPPLNSEQFIRDMIVDAWAC